MHILIVEDEPELSSLLAEYLANAGFESECIAHGDTASQWLSQHQTDLVVLDLMLPGKDGLTICRELRQHSRIPVIMATAKVEEIDRLLGLEIGADDYICKPYSPREVVARIKAVLRRVHWPEENKPIVVDTEKLQVILQGKHVEFTAVEMRLFELLYREPGKIFSRQYIMDHIYTDYRVVSDRTVDSHVKKLRKKLHEAAPDLDLIHSIYGAGYKFEYQDV